MTLFAASINVPARRMSAGAAVSIGSLFGANRALAKPPGSPPR